MNRFRSIFPNKHVVLPVIHVASQEQALRNTVIAIDAKADGVFLINHAISSNGLLDILSAVADAYPGFWIGVNCLDLDPEDVFRRVSSMVKGVWTDSAMIDETAAEQTRAKAIQKIHQSTGWQGLYFGGVAFKYQRPVEDLESAALLARDFMDVVTTSGPGTGQAAHLEKIKIMKAALVDFPLAIASGITPENITEYLPFSDCYLVATGVSRSFEELDPPLVRSLVNKVCRFDQKDW
jgi:hypothetical protein